MKRFYIQCAVERAQGYQMWSVEAEDEEQAFAKFELGECSHVADEIEVTTTGEPEISSSEELGDTEAKK